MTRDEAAPYLRRLFAAGDDGLSPSEFAQAIGLSVPTAMAILEDLYRQRLVARVPNPKGMGYLCRIPKRGDHQAGFLYEPQGETMIKLKKAKKGKAAKPAKADQIPLF